MRVGLQAQYPVRTALNIRRCLMLACALLLQAACLTTPKQTPLQKRLGPSVLTASELRVRVRDLSPRFAGVLELMAAEVAQSATDADTRAQVTEFKINAVPQMHLALFRPDPVAALVDAWALVAQTEQFVARLETDGVVTERTAEIARRRLAGLEGELEGLWSTVVGQEDVSRPRELVHQWAAENPIEFMATRVSTVELLAKVTSGSGLKSLRAAPGQLFESMQDLVARLDYLVAVLPKEARWQAELLIERDLERITRRVTRAAVDEGLEAITTTENLTRVERVVEHGIGAALRRSLRGALEGAGGEEQETASAAHATVLPAARVWPARATQRPGVSSAPAEEEAGAAQAECISQPMSVGTDRGVLSELLLFALLLGFVFGAAAIGLFFLGWHMGRRHGHAS
ncbi:MAG: hypothetical protein WBV82_30415 [Myxococcaceae bacterium]